MSQPVPAAARQRSPVSALLLGTMLFLASELLLFGGLFAAYFYLRADTAPWPPDGADLDVTLAAIGTALLVLSSGTYQLAARSAEARAARSFFRWIAVTMVLGLVFLCLQLYDFSQLGFAVSSHAYGTMYFTMTGIHGLHVLAGLVLMVVVAGRATRAIARGEIDAVHASGYYWHFVDAVWIALFATLYLVR
jgi:cytochrome c oxidase subunit III